MVKKILSTLSAALLLSMMFPQASLAQWKAYLAYAEPTEIERTAAGTLYVLASDNLYSYNTGDRSLQTYDKTTVLSDCGIAHIAWCQRAHRLVIVYNDQNIDLLEENSNVVNLADYMNKSMTDDKTVNALCVDGAYAYLSTGFGIVKVNVADAEISDTYQLGFNVDYCTVHGDTIVAASASRGLYRGLSSDNLLDPANWRRIGAYTPQNKTMNAEDLALVRTLNPGGPQQNHFRCMTFTGGRLYTVPGGYEVTTELNYPAAVQILTGDSWTIYSDNNIAATTGVPYTDLTWIAVNPTNPNQVFAGGRTGLYEYNNSLTNNQFVRLYNAHNSPIEAAAGDGWTLVLGGTFDRNGNLWVLNSQAPTQSILEYTSGGEWNSHTQSALMRLNGRLSLGMLTGPYFDSRNLMWFVNDNWQLPALYCYQPSSGGMNGYTSFINEDGTTVQNITNVRCVTEDRDGNIWAGTNVGPLMLEPDQISATQPIFTQVKVPRNDGTDYADYLLSGVDISCIMVDGANRKWFGTHGNGVYLFGADNITQIYHFTAENSQLLSNDITSMAINSNTGEVYIGTDKGLCSFMSNGTSGGGMTKDNVYAYPNPVKPDYRGAITITGLDEDADVKIVTANGTLVNSGRASGGQYRWYGLDQDGRRVASGVYMVEVATSDGDKGVVCKVAIIN